MSYDPKAAAAAGATWLDTHAPGWRDHVDAEVLDMRSGDIGDGSTCGCVCAQIDWGTNPEQGSGDYVHFFRSRALGYQHSPWHVEHGFVAPMTLAGDIIESDWDALTEAWKELL